MENILRIVILTFITVLILTILWRKPLNNNEVNLKQNFNNSLVNETPGTKKDKALEEIERKLVLAPINDDKSRITKKPFGIRITPQDSPVQPERFAGYHTGVDFEIKEDELNRAVEINTICEGEIIQKGRINGYGGVVIQGCLLNDEPVTVLYGHIDLTSVHQNVGDKVLAGDKLAVLGADKSSDTDGERKHLHLGIHKGNAIDVRGYVQNVNELNQWLDFGELVANFDEGSVK